MIILIIDKLVLEDKFLIEIFSPHFIILYIYICGGKRKIQEEVDKKRGKKHKKRKREKKKREKRERNTERGRGEEEGSMGLSSSSSPISSHILHHLLMAKVSSQLKILMG